MREVKIVENDKEYIVKINKITYGTYNSIMQTVSNMQVVGNVSKGSFDIFKFRRMVMEASVVLPEGLRFDTLSVQSGQLLEHEALVENGLEAAEEGFFLNSE